MKFILTLSILLFSIFCFAQNEANEETAQQFYKEGKAILADSIVKAFNKLQALDQFQLSQKTLQDNGISASEWVDTSQQEIVNIITYFSQFQNRDSLLALTRFYPDSIFRANRRYTNAFKTLIREYLTLKNSVSRKAFFKLRNLNYSQTAKGAPSYIINFENYWPLEVFEFEEWLQKNEQINRKTPAEVRAELLYRRLQFQLDSLNQQELNAYYQSNNTHLLEKINTAQKETVTAKSKFQRFKNYGLGGLALFLIGGYFVWKRNEQLLRSKNQALLEEKRKSDEILTNILPAEVVRQIKNKNVAKAQKKDSVGVLFTDFKDFSQISKSLPPEELVSELDYCFSGFDRIIEKYRLQKIKTIGDAYMCVGGLYTKGEQHIPRMVSAALEIQQFLNNRKTQRKNLGSYFFDARIGIHTGPVVAGIIGTNKYAFDVWGDTVNVAQQMEQHCEVGKVNISGETHALVKEQFNCSHRGEIVVKNKRVYDLYYVEGKNKNS